MTIKIGQDARAGVSGFGSDSAKPVCRSKSGLNVGKGLGD
jgi:hypothetical protein